MKTKERTSAMYHIAINAYFFKQEEFEKNYFSLPDYEIWLMGHLAHLFHIKPTYGKSPARTLFDRLSEYHKKEVLKNE